MLNRDKRIVAIHIHAQIGAGIGNLRAHIAQTNNGNALAFQLTADECFLRLFRIDENIGVGGILANPIHRLHHAAARKHERIEHDDALLGVFLDRNIVHAGATAGDGANAIGQFVAMQVGRTHENRIGVLGLGHEFIAIAKGNLTVFRNVIDSFDIAHGNLLFMSNPLPNLTEAFNFQRP